MKAQIAVVDKGVVLGGCSIELWGFCDLGLIDEWSGSGAGICFPYLAKSVYKSNNGFEKWN